MVIKIFFILKVLLVFIIFECLNSFLINNIIFYIYIFFIEVKVDI